VILCHDDKQVLLSFLDKKMIERRCKHKSHINKVIFGAYLACQRKNPVTGEWWDGKVHLHPSVEFKAAQHNSVHHPADTIETKIQSMSTKNSLAGRLLSM
jgi:hypothetical protein